MQTLVNISQFDTLVRSGGAAQGVMATSNDKSVLDKYAPYMDDPRMRTSIDRLHELKKEFLVAREELRALGGDVTTDNDFLNEP
jgi:hypothetical protein